MGSDNGFIEPELYSDIHRLMPIPCVDIVVVRGDRALLVHRREEPARGRYWIPGGRIRRGESLPAAAQRLVLAETGIEIDVPILVDAESLIFQTDPFGHGKGTHAVAIVMAARCVSDGDIELDGNHDNALWSSGHDASLDSYVKNAIRNGVMKVKVREAMANGTATKVAKQRLEDIRKRMERSGPPSAPPPAIVPPPPGP